MIRKFGTTGTGDAFRSLTVVQVWEKGIAVDGYDPNVWRKDVCGAWMRFDKYGDTSSRHGWEIDHIKPVAHGGPDALSNYQPLQWENNRAKSDTWPWSP